MALDIEPRRLDILFDYFIAKAQYYNYLNRIDYKSTQSIKKDLDEVRNRF